MTPSPLNSDRFSFHSASHTDQWLLFISKLLDAFFVAGVLAATVAAYRPTWDIKYTLAALLAAMLFFLFAEVAGLYRPWRGESITRRFFQILMVWFGTVFILLLVAYGFKISQDYSRLAIGTWLLVTPFLLSGWRIFGKIIFSHVVNQESQKRNALVWGAGELGEQLKNTIEQSPWLGLRLTEYVRDEQSAEPISDGEAHLGHRHLAELERLELRAKRGDFDIVYIALPISARKRITALIDRLSDTTVSIYMVPDYFTTSLFHGKWSSLEGIPLISVFDTPFWGADGLIKRMQDIVLSILFLFLATIPMVLIVVAVKFASPGPAIFRQRRYGIDGREISVWKFRTMRVCENGSQIPQATKNDPRVTTLGAILRSTSLDELPQLFNVLMGDMSIVGPRPHAVSHNEQYRKQVKGYMLRHKVRPGITGWAQVNGWRGETDSVDKMQKRVEHDLWYIRNWSLWLDLKIIMLTVQCGFTSKNAY